MVKKFFAAPFALATAFTLAGCHGAGTHYTLMVTSSAETAQQATEVSVNLLRTGTSQALNFDFTPPMPTPEQPWVFDLQTREWGPVPIECEVFALNSFGLLASGTAGPDAGIIRIQLQDMVNPFGPDLAEPPPFPFDFGFGPPIDFGFSGGDLPLPFDGGLPPPLDGGAPDLFE